MSKVALQMPGKADLGLMVFARLLLVLSLCLLPLIIWQGRLWLAEPDSLSDTMSMPDAMNGPAVMADSTGRADSAGRFEAAGMEKRAGRAAPYADSARQLDFADPSSEPLTAIAREWLRLEAERVLRLLGRAAYAGNADMPELLRQALKDLFPKLDRRAYYMLWQGTAVVCSPLNPEIAAMDLGHLTDAYGVRFVAEMAALAGQGGGFISFRLAAPASEHSEPHPGGKAAHSEPRPGEVGGAQPGEVGGAQHGEVGGTFLAYAAPFENSGIYLTVWLSAADSGKLIDGAFSAFAPFKLKQEQTAPAYRRDVLLGGLVLLQLSALGLGLVLRNGRW